MASEDFIAFDEPGSSKPARGPRPERVNTTVFVSSLPYAATSTDLLTHFSFIGPVRHGFVATDKETGKSKGVGYVTYSLREDAERAVTELDGGDFGPKGRKIRVAWADAKPERGEEPIERPKKQPRITAEDTAGPSDPDAIKTLVLSGLPDGLTKAVLWKRIRKVDDSAEILFPVEGEDRVAHIVFTSHGAALQAIPKLHGHIYKGALLSCVLKKRLEKLSAQGEGKAQSHAGRLIVRNLAWDTTEQDLRATFLRFGPLHSVDLPTLPTKLPASADPSKPAPPPRARGFAFVWFLVRKDAERAMEAINGKSIKRVGERKGKVKGDDRPVAVDWALSKEKWEETQKGDVKEEKEAKEKDGETSSSGSSSGSEDSSDSDEDEESDATSESGEEDEEKMDVDEAEEEEPVKPTLPSVDVGATLFIRNLPFETTEQELSTLFRTFGPLRYAKITIDKVTGRSRGSGFVCFWNVEHADKAIEEAEKVAQETGANAQPLGGKNPFALPSVLTADPSSALVSKLVLHGRTLEVSRAVTRETAGQMKEDGERARIAGDKRNTYLMREGVIFPNSPAAQGLPEAEIEKRQQAFNARRTLLRSNPSLYISKTRLSIRQLPLFVTDRTLKRLGIHAVRAFGDEVASGEREGLSRAEETDNTLSPALEARAESSKKSKKRGERETAVIQSKVVRQSEKVDPLTGTGKSKGYGFLEMRSHKDALKVLRYANNNPAVGPIMWEWWKTEMAEVLERTKKALKELNDGEKEVKEGKENKEELEARIKRLEARVKEGNDRSGGGMRGGKTLMIEFSIENVQVVRRRVDKISSVRDGPPEKRRRPAEDTDDEADTAKLDRAGKKQKWDRDGGKAGPGGRSKRDDKRKDRDSKVPKAIDAKPEEREKKGLEKLGAQLGSMIGRKRKQRQGGK
ncbi:hypothetical protein BCR39DRAFT_553517 [Naematelia encephala]|uniref:RRM domain-containing protein n=1 Tax=Naematelia encephala TaxID=71784 RepID=A0A1Y2AFR8_9TREE|nr:hypothetical protein BCR39DRAFT_553517 [Naematelia encephala]